MPKVSFDFSEEAYDKLTEMSDVGNCTKADTVRKALRLLDYYNQEIANGCSFVIKKGKDLTEIEIEF